MRAALSLIVLLGVIAAVPSTAGAVTLEGARSKAQQATRAERARSGVILFGLRSPLRSRTQIREAGRRPPPTGASRRAMRSVLTVRERAYFFYLDRGAHRSYEHPGRVVLVGAVSGRVIRSRSLRFAPTVDGRLPVFLRSREGYEDPRYRVFSRAYSVGGSARAVSPGLSAFGATARGFGLRSAASERTVAARLAAERSCTVVVGTRRGDDLSTLGSASGSRVLPLLVYDQSGSRSLASFITSQAIGTRGCRDILIAVSGDGYGSLAPASTRTGLSTSGTRMREYHVNAAVLRAIIAANPSVTFKLMIDGQGSGSYIETLRALANVLVIATSSSAHQTAFRYLPSKRIGGRLTNNPLRMRADSSFLTTQLFGAAAFAASDAEVAHAAAEVDAGRAPSFLAYLIARGFQLSRPFDFTSDLGQTQRLYTRFAVTAPGPTNRAPVANAQTVTTTEDTPKPIVLSASDPDGDALTYAIGTAPAHGTLSGSAPNLTYAPAANYDGPDSFTFTASDGTLVSATATVTIDVAAADDPPVTTASGTLAYTENDPATAIAPALTVTDADSASLTGATVQISAGYENGEDALGLPAQPAIASAFDAPTGTLTLSGTATVAAYQAALRAVTYANTSDDPSSSPRTVTFRSRDAGGFGPAANRTVTVTPVNDPPAITTSAGPLSYTENDPATAIDGGLVLTDPDSQITGATVQITTNLASGEDLLALPAQPGIGGAYSAATGTLTLTGTASVAAYQTALRAVTYRNTSTKPNTAQRTVTFLASDASSSSAPATRAIAVNATDNAPDVNNSAGALAYTENDQATAIDMSIAITDPDSANLTGATIQITGNYVQGEDVLAFTPAGGVSANPFDAPTGRLTLTGTASVAAYEAALEAVTYRNTSDDPSTATRTVTFQARDVSGFGLADTHAVTIAPVDDAPVAVDDSAMVAEDSGASAVAVLPNDTDVDAGPKSVASVKQPANGTVVITGGGTGLTYVPNANYCNSPQGTTPDTFTYTLAPGGSAATVSMTVTCVDDPPVAVDDSATVAEDAGSSAVDVLADDTDIDGGPISVGSVTQPANGTVVNSGTSVSYTPSPDYCNSPPGTTPDSFTYALTPGSSSATVSVTVSCADDPPVAVADSATVGEDSGSNPVDVLANDTDADGGPQSVASVTQPANGAVAITGGGTAVSYTPNANYCNSPPAGALDTFTYTLGGGSVALVAMTVTCVNDAPNVTTSGGSLAYTENQAAAAIDAGVTVTDGDSNLVSATVAITAGFQSGQDVLALSGSHAPIVASLNAGGDVLTLSGTASPAAYQAALRAVTYANTSDNPSTAARTATFTVSDGALTDSDMRPVTVSAADDPPSAVANSATVAEDSGSTMLDVLANDMDVDGGPKSVASVTQPANGSVVNNSSSVSYTPNANYCNVPPGGEPDTFTYTLNGGSVASVAISVTCVADAPVVDTSAGTATYTENAAATAIDAAVLVTDADAGATITGATVAITANFAVGDVLALGGINPGISAVVAGNTLTLSGTATVAAYQAALRNVTYLSTSEGPSTLLRTVTFTVTDNTALQGSDTKSVQVTAVNDPPNAVDDSGTTDEDTTLSVSAPGVLANDTDVDPGDTQTVVALNGSGTLTQVLPSGASVTINANGSYSYNPLSAFQGLSTGQSATDSFTYTMQDGAAAQSTATVNLTINGISDAPTAVADSFDAIGNTGLFVGTTRPAAQAGKEITGSVLTNDTDPDTPQASLVAEPVTNAPTTLGGTITIESDGNFTYHPDDVDTGMTDTFTYRVCDASPCNSGTVANATGTLSLPIAGQVWYVRNNEAAGGDGTSDTPFDTLLEAETASGANDTVFVFDGNNTATNLGTGYVMDSGERLIGESQPLSLDPDGGGPLPTSSLHPGTSGAQPTLTASNEDVVVLASNTVVDGVDLDPGGTGGGISGGVGTSNVTVGHVNVVDTGTAGTQPGIELDGTAGTNRFSNTTVQNGASATAIGVRINNAGTVQFAQAGTNTITTTGAKALDITSTSTGTSEWDDITVTGSGTGAVRLNSATGTTRLGDGTGTDLSLQTTSGATAALDIASSTQTIVDGSGSDSVDATGGPALDIRNTNSSTFNLDSVSSSNSAGDGINLDTNLTTPVTAIGGAISGAAGIAFDVNGGGLGGAGVVYPGAINDGPGQTAEITGRDGTAVILSGNIADSNDAGGGIVVSANSGGAMTFSGTSKVLSTGASTAVSHTSNAPGTALSFQNGGLDIDTTSGAGIDSATNGGTIDVQGAGNTIDTGTGRALRIQNSSIAAADVTLQRVSSNGAPSGILLDTTGAAGNLVVTGIGGTCTAASTGGCSGGQIANSTGADDTSTTPVGTGVVLRSTTSPSLTRMWIHDASNYGIRGTTVNGFTMADSVVNGVNGTSALSANKDGSVRFEELTGTVAVTNTDVRGGYFTNVMVDNTAGTLNATLDNVDSGTLDATGGDDAVQFEGIGTSMMNVTYQNSSLTTATGDLFQYIGDGTGGGNLALTGNTFTNNEPSIATGGGGIAVTAGAKGTATVNVDANTMRDSLTNALTVIKTRDVAAGTNNLTATINNNQIGVGATANSGSVEGDGMEITTFGDGNATFNVTNNTIRQYNSSAIQFVAGGGIVESGQFNLNISGNSAANPGMNPSITLLQGIRVDSGVTAGDTFAACVNFGANSITGSSDAANKDFRLVASQSTTIRQPGYGGTATDGPAFAAFAAGKIGSGASGTAVANAPATFSGTGTACP